MLRRSKARRWSGVGSASMGTSVPVSLVADLVAGEGGQVVEQAAEAAQWVAGGVVFAGGLGVGVGGALRGCDGVVALGWVFVGECQWRPGLAQVPDQVAGEHADQHVGFDAVVEAVVDGAQVQVVGLDDAEVAFDVGEVLVAVDHCGGVECGRLSTLVRST